MLLNKWKNFINWKITTRVDLDIIDLIWGQKVKNGEVSKFNFYYWKIYENLKFNFLQKRYLHNLVLYLSETVRPCSLWVYMPFFWAFQIFQTISKFCTVYLVLPSIHFVLNSPNMFVLCAVYSPCIYHVFSLHLHCIFVDFSLKLPFIHSESTLYLLFTIQLCCNQPVFILYSSFVDCFFSLFLSSSFQ